MGGHEAFRGVRDWTTLWRQGASLARRRNRVRLFESIYSYSPLYIPVYNANNATDQETEFAVEHRRRVDSFVGIVRSLSYYLHPLNEHGRFLSIYPNREVDTREQRDWILPFYQVGYQVNRRDEGNRDNAEG